MKKEMLIYSKENNDITFDKFVEKINSDYNGLVFDKIIKDPIGKSGTNPTWGRVFGYKNGQLSQDYQVGLYKEYDWERPESAHAEKIWSIIGKIMLDDCRVPDIDIINDKINDGAGVLSYRIMNNDFEDLTNLNSIVYRKFERQELKKYRGYIYIEDLFKAIKEEISDIDNYKKMEKSIIEVILLDSITNNADRHLDNWAMIRNKNTNQYSLGLFDHSSSFIGLDPRNRNSLNGWISSYLCIDPPEKWNKILIGSNGKKLTEYISQNYTKYYNEFLEKFEDRLKKFYEKIDGETGSISQRLIKSNFDLKLSKLNQLAHKNIEGVEYGK